MPVVTEAQARTQLKNRIKILKDFQSSMISGGTAFLTNYDADLLTRYTNDPAGGVGPLQGFRGGVNSLILSAPALLDECIRTYGEAISAPEKDALSILKRMDDWFVANGYTIQARNISYGTPAAGGGNVGDGVLNILSKDENNFNIENINPDSWTARCVQDVAGGATKHEEVFELYSREREVDEIQIVGAGFKSFVRGWSGRDTEQYVSNPSFESYEGTAITALTSITDWTVGTIGNFTLSETAADIYRDYEGITTPRSVKISATDYMEQALSIKRTAFDQNTPWYCQLAWNRELYTASGTLQITLGGVTASVVAAAQTGWQILRIVLGQNNWPKKWNTTDPKVRVDWTRTGGTIAIDDFMLVPMTNIDGLWCCPVGGRTKWLAPKAAGVADVYTWTNALVGSDSIIQYWLNKAYRRQLPHTTGAPTITDP
jgi:hypothetical protein